VTPQEQARIRENAEARAAVVARMQDGTVTLTEADAKLMSGTEITQCIDLGRFGPDIGRDKRLSRR
jgi:hypothetical protein